MMKIYTWLIYNYTVSMHGPIQAKNKTEERKFK